MWWNETIHRLDSLKHTKDIQNKDNNNQQQTQRITTQANEHKQNYNTLSNDVVELLYDDINMQIYLKIYFELNVTMKKNTHKRNRIAVFYRPIS